MQEYLMGTFADCLKDYLDVITKERHFVLTTQEQVDIRPVSCLLTTIVPGLPQCQPYAPIYRVSNFVCRVLVREIERHVTRVELRQPVLIVISYQDYHMLFAAHSRRPKIEDLMRLIVHPALLEGKTTDRAHVLWETLQGFQDVANGLRVNTSSNSIAGWDDVVVNSLGDNVTKMPF